jgi:hypothetical protein
MTRYKVQKSKIIIQHGTVYWTFQALLQYLKRSIDVCAYDVCVFFTYYKIVWDQLFTRLAGLSVAEERARELEQSAVQIVHCKAVVL